jgi:hypothetical protein
MLDLMLMYLDADSCYGNPSGAVQLIPHGRYPKCTHAIRSAFPGKQFNRSREPDLDSYFRDDDADPML